MLGGRCRITDPGPGNHRRTGPTAAVNRIRSLSGVAMSPPASTISLCPSFLDPWPQPLVVLERYPEPDADRFVPCAPAHRKPCWRRLLAALPFDVGAQVGLTVEELAADARPRGNDRERDRFAAPARARPARCVRAPRRPSSARLPPCAGRWRARGSRAFFRVSGCRLRMTRATGSARCPPRDGLRSCASTVRSRATWTGPGNRATSSPLDQRERSSCQVATRRRCCAWQHERVLSKSRGAPLTSRRSATCLPPRVRRSALPSRAARAKLRP